MIGDLISAGTKLLGGYFSDKETAKQQEANRALQREFAQSGIQWKVADAKAAGVHPLAALGTSVSMPAVSVQPSAMGAAIGSMGQDISRAIASTASPDTRASMYSNSMMELNLENAKLRNEMLKNQIASSFARLGQGGQVGPPMPTGHATANIKDLSFGDDGPRHPMGDYKPVTPVLIGGDRFRHDPRYSDAKQAEDRWGEFGGDMYGLYVMMMDHLNHYVGSPSEVAADMAERRRGMKYGRPLGRR